MKKCRSTTPAPSQNVCKCCFDNGLERRRNTRKPPYPASCSRSPVSGIPHPASFSRGSLNPQPSTLNPVRIWPANNSPKDKTPS
jgi:hypothetical protein